MKEIGLNPWDEDSGFSIVIGGKTILSCKYDTLLFYADYLRFGVNNTILTELLQPLKDIYGFTNSDIEYLDNELLQMRKRVLEKLPPILKEELEKEKFAKTIHNNMGREYELDWRRGKSEEEIQKIEKEFNDLERQSLDNSNFLVDDKGTKIWIGPDRNREEMIRIYESYKKENTKVVEKEEKEEKEGYEVEKIVKVFR